MTDAAKVEKTWTVKTTKVFDAELKKLDRTVALQILKKLRRLETLDDPTVQCKALAGPLAGLWRLRVGDWRVVLDIQCDALVVLALDVDHRSKIYAKTISH